MIKFRLMSDFDIPYVCRIQRQAFGKSTPNVFEKALNNSINIYGVALNNKIIVGYFGISIIDSECEILSIAVDELYRRQGIGNNIMNFVFDIAKERGAKIIYLEVNEHNIPAFNLYSKLGFEHFYTRKNYYGEESAFVLKKVL